jgi:hypothetical protein
VAKTGASDGNMRVYYSDAVSDYITLTVNAPQTDIYNIKAIIPKNNYRGIFQLSIDGNNVGSAYDAYNASLSFVEETLASNVSLTAGNHSFKFTVAGKNSSSLDYQIALDTITLESVESTYEAEDLTVAASSGDTIQTVAKSGASDGNMLLFNADAVSDYITLTVNAPQSGSYDIKAIIPKNSFRSIFQLSVDGNDVGSAYDAYNATLTFVEETLANNVSLTAGNHSFKFTVTGSNSSSLDYQIALDTLTLDAVAQAQPRSVYYEVDLETGQVQARSSVVHDAIGVKTLLESGPPKSITGITKANPAVVTSNNHGYADGTGVTITGVNGMTELNGRLFRVKNATTNTFELWEDHPPGVANTGHTLGTYQVDSTGYGTYTTGGTMMTWSQQTVDSGGAGPGSNLDVRVEQSETVDGQLVLPRKGNYFLRSLIDFDKDYSVYSGNGSKNKPRWTGTPPNDTEFDYDTEAWHGISYFIPEGFEDETGTTGQQGENQLLDISEDSGPSGGGFFIISVVVPDGKANVGGIEGETAHWVGKEFHSDTSTTLGTIRYYDLGEVDPDKGKWTDFIIRSRVNPFSVSTNASTITGGKDHVYPGNKGILQVWKATGAVDGNGDRTMTLMIDRENEPVGMVPRDGYLIHTSVRQYKYGWHHNPTDVDGPVWIGYDEIRFGETLRDGTGYSDVHPSQLSMP